MHNRTELVKMAHGCCTGAINTVIFKSVDQHLIDVLDVIPPVPGWLTYMVGQLDSCLLGELGVVFTENIWLTYMVGQLDSCLLGELGVVFTENILDLRQFESEDAAATLIGCDISKMILEARFPGLDYKFTNICSRTSDLYQIKKPFIARCCQSEHSGLIEIDGIDGVVVHWAASGYEVADALRDLVRKIRSRP